MLKLIRLVLVVAWLPAMSYADEIYVPDELQDWTAWVLQDAEYRDCPFFFNRGAAQRSDFVCAWPGELQLQVGADGGRFALPYNVYAEEQWLSLPGDASHWPFAVTVNGKTTEVIERNGVPSIHLAPGKYRIAGRFEWDERPGSLRIPVEAGLVALTLNGKPVARPEINRGGIFLGEKKQQTQTRDAVRTEVYRLVRDEVPLRLTSNLQIDVSGGVREELFGPVLPEGFVPLSLQSQLPARLEADGRLRVQVRPGRWQITLMARAPGVLNEVTLPSPETNLPDSEIWSYQSNDRLRVTSAEGLPPVDPTQVRVPGQWQELPAFRIEPGETLRITERSRGAVAADNQLRLDRTMWLDYNGDGYVVQDSISGQMRTGWRLDMTAPYELLSASSWDDVLLITKGDGDGETGVELRQANVQLEAIGRSETRGAMPATGWDGRFAHVNTQLNLPPGEKLLAAPGADQAPGSWVSQWKLLHFFLLLIITIATWKLFGRVGGIVALFAITLSYHELMSPLWLWLNVLAVVALLRVAPAGRLRTSLLLYQGLSLLALVAVLVPFIAGQLKIAIYPQLERQAAIAYFSTDEADYEEEPYARELDQRALMQDAVRKAAPIEEIVVSGSSVSRSYSRYAPNAIVQAGPGVPSWRWNSYRLSWSGPVDPEQSLRLIVMPRWLVSLLRFTQVGLLLLFAGLIAAEVVGKRWKLPGGLTIGGGKAVAASCLLALFMTASPPAEAETPDAEILQQLQARLLAPPDCVPRCAEIASARVEVGSGRVTVRMTVHAMEEVALPLPGSQAGWRPNAILVDGSGGAEVLRGEDQLLWLRVTAGQHSVTMSGDIPDVDSLEIPFRTPPRFVEVSSEQWLVSGIKDRRLTSGSLQLTRLQTESGDDDTVRWESSRFPAFVHVERAISLDLDWSVMTNVIRVAPEQGILTLDLPLLNGETVLSEDFTIEDGRILVSMAPQERVASWRSNLPRTSPLVLTAAQNAAWKEVWRIGVGSVWNASFSGLPESETGSSSDEARVAEFHPRPGESLTMEATRPEASAGTTLAFDSVALQTDLGNRSRNVSLELAYRSTRGSQHVIVLPANAEVTEVQLDDEVQPYRAEDGKLTLPILPGEHDISVSWREPSRTAFRSQTSVVDLGAPASNINLGLELPRDRWLLATGGPRLGPGVLYWSELAALILFAIILGRVGLAPLKTWQWLLLSIGFSMFSWFALAWVVIWLLACGARQRWDIKLNWWRFNAIQVAIAVLTVIAMASIIVSLQVGLLGTPDMSVAGNNSYGNSLHWFADRSESVLPTAYAFAVPMWSYKVMILAWALWLSFALLKWLPWAWDSFSKHGFWRSREHDALQSSGSAE
jgi:hypothetical protein